MKIGELARRTRVNVQTLRYYEKRGLLAAPLRDASGYRAYDRPAVSTVRFIKAAQRLGFRLTEVESLLQLFHEDPRRCPDVQQIAARRVAELRADIAGLEATCAELERLLRLCTKPRGNPRCPVLELMAQPCASEEDGPLDRNRDPVDRVDAELLVVSGMPLRPPRIQILYVRDCPRLDDARAIVRLALSRTGLHVPVQELEGAYASPTVLVNGVDVTGKAGPAGHACRLDLPTVDQVVAALAAVGARAECEVCRSPVTVAAFRELLRTGAPAACEHLAAILGRGERAVAEEIGQLDGRGQVAVGPDGRVVGAAGLSVTPGRHEVRAQGRRFWTWCAYDAIGIMAALGASGEVLSRDPSTGAAIRVTCERGAPARTGVVLLLPDDGCCAVPRDTWCPLVNFFESAEGAHAWARAHGVVGSVVATDSIAASAGAEWAALVPQTI